MKQILTHSLLATSLILLAFANVQAVIGSVPFSGIVLAINAEQDVIINGATTSGIIRHGGILNGTTTDIFTSQLTPTPDSNTFSLTDTLTITTTHGILTCNDVTLFSPTQQVFTTISKVSSGTGIFKGAVGTLFISGTTTNGINYDDRIIGEITISPNLGP